jgi:hypothetical protein
MGLDDITSEASKTFNRQGAWALLAVGLIIAVGWGMIGIAKRGDILLTEYLAVQKAMMMDLATASKSNAAATEKVSDAVTNLVMFSQGVDKEHAAMVKSLTAIQGYIDIDDGREQQTLEQLKELVSLMKTANTMMQGSVMEREESKQILGRIEKGIEDLTTAMKDHCLALPEEAEEPSP